MSALFYPRISQAVASDLLAELSTLTAGELPARSALEHRSMTFYPTATRRAGPEQLGRLRDALRAVAARNGYPQAAQRGSAQFRKFDQAIALILHNEMDIVVADASDDGVWSFLSLVVAPDVAFWRFPNRQAREDYERLLGRPRNVFRRLWWRAHVLGPELGPRLLEDEAVAILERPAIGGNPAVARAIATAHLAATGADAAVPRTELLRDAMKRVRRLAAVVALEGLQQNELDELVAGIFRDALRAVAGFDTVAPSGSDDAGA